MLHASALANAAAATRDGDQQAAAGWERVAGQVWESVLEGNAAALAYLQAEAGQTRAGYHPGERWEDAWQWVIASFRQHVSRDGDPQLHVHNLILHKVRRESDGQWRALDSMSLYRHRPAASAIAAVVMEAALTRRLGVAWVQRCDGHGREIAGVGQALMDEFSSRRASIGPLAARLARELQARTGRAPDARALASLRQWANHSTRRAKQAAPLDLASLTERWAAQAAEAESGALEPLAPEILNAGARLQQRSRGAGPPAPLGPRAQAQRAAPGTAPPPPPRPAPALHAAFATPESLPQSASVPKRDLLGVGRLLESRSIYQLRAQATYSRMPGRAGRARLIQLRFVQIACGAPWRLASGGV